LQFQGLREIRPHLLCQLAFQRPERLPGFVPVSLNPLALSLRAA
jgi:hypothetical protein